MAAARLLNTSAEAVERLEWQLVAAFKKEDFRRARHLLKRRLALVPLMPPLLPEDQAKLDSLPGLLDQAERSVWKPGGSPPK
jgi:hypothetical protein